MYCSQRGRVYFKIIPILLCCIKAIYGEDVYDYIAQQHYEDFTLSPSNVRFARLRCLQQYPKADVIGFKDSPDTHCFLQCYIVKLGLIDLNTRGLDNRKILDILDDIEKSSSDEKCMGKYDFGESLSGKCSDCYKKLMDVRSNCKEFFEYVFAVNSTRKADESLQSKSIGQSASEYCDSIDEDHEFVTETSQSLEATFLQHYKRRLECLYDNFHYLDGYGRVDEAELILSYQEFKIDTAETRTAIKICAQRANAKYLKDYLGDLVFELQQCLKKLSPEFAKVSQRRDEVTRDY